MSAPGGEENPKLPGSTEVKMTDFKVEPPNPFGLGIKTGESRQAHLRVGRRAEACQQVADKISSDFQAEPGAKPWFGFLVCRRSNQAGPTRFDGPSPALRHGGLSNEGMVVSSSSSLRFGLGPIPTRWYRVGLSGDNRSRRG